MEKSSVVGIDIACDKFDVNFKEKQEDGRLVIKGSTHFDNQLSGFRKLQAWVGARTKKSGSSVSFVMEATGVYYEELAYFLYESGFKVHVVLPNKAKHYFKSQNLKTKTDKVDAAALAQMGFEMNLRTWEPMSDIYLELRDCTRAILALQSEKSSMSSRLHACKHSRNKLKEVIRAYERQVKSLDKEIERLKKHRTKVLDKDEELKKKVTKVATIKCVQNDTIISVISETNGFLLINSMRQLVSYAGLDVSHEQSGKKKGKGKISKKGNARLRQIIFMPALSAIQHNKPIKETYQRIVEKHPTVKMIGVVAAMRKLLLQIYTLWKKDEEFDENHQWGK